MIAKKFVYENYTDYLVLRFYGTFRKNIRVTPISFEDITRL